MSVRRDKVTVWYECEECGEGWDVDYDDLLAVPSLDEIDCPTPEDHDESCPGECGCDEGECDCCPDECDNGNPDCDCGEGHTPSPEPASGVLGTGDPAVDGVLKVALNPANAEEAFRLMVAAFEGAAPSQHSGGRHPLAPPGK